MAGDADKPLRERTRAYIGTLYERVPVAHRAGRLRRYARALTRNVSRSDDLVQDTLARAREGASLGARNRYAAWLFTIIHNQNVNAVRSAIREGIALDIEELSWSLVATTDPTAARQLHEFDWALAQMPEEQRQVILLVGLECMKTGAAEILNVPIGTIRSREVGMRSAS